MLERHRGEDAGNLRRIEMVEKWTCLNLLETDFLKSDSMILINERSWTIRKSKENIVMHEEMVQNIVVDTQIDL